MKTDIEYKKGVLVIRLSGTLSGNRKIKMFEREVIPIVLGLRSKYITVNINDLNNIDVNGIDSIIKLSSIANSFNGKLAVCNINDSVNSIINNSDIFDYCFHSKNETTSRGIFYL